MALDDMSVGEVEAFEIPAGTSILYRFDREARPLGWRYLDTARDCAKAA